MGFDPLDDRESRAWERLRVRAELIRLRRRLWLFQTILSGIALGVFAYGVWALFA